MLVGWLVSKHEMVPHLSVLQEVLVRYWLVCLKLGSVGEFDKYWSISFYSSLFLYFFCFVCFINPASVSYLAYETTPYIKDGILVESRVSEGTTFLAACWLK